MVALLATLGLVEANELPLSEATDGQETATACGWAGDYPVPPGEVREVSGRLQAGDCILTVRGSQRWADPYTFTLTTQSLVTLTLTSSDVDPYLFLRRMGDYSVIEEDDDSGSGRNSRIERQLAAGRYRVDATKYDSPLGSYTLSIRVASSRSSSSSRVMVRESSECAVNLGHLPSSSRTGSLASADCRDPFDRNGYAEILSFRLSNRAQVTIRMESSSFDAFLRLLDGDGDEITSDNNSGGSLHALISRTLDAGSDQIIATEASSGRATGRYRLEYSVAEISASHQQADFASAEEYSSVAEALFRGVSYYSAYNDWGCPFVGNCSITEGQRANYRSGQASVYAGINLVATACNGYRGGHRGWDFQTTSKGNEHFYSLSSGIVTRAGGDSLNTIAVYNSVEDVTVVYLHASQVHVREDTRVTVGQLLGSQGNTGTGSNHVHVEIREGRQDLGGCGAGASPVQAWPDSWSSRPTLGMEGFASLLP